MADYRLVAAIPGQMHQSVQRLSDDAVIPFDPANRDYQLFCQWCDEGNTPDPAPEPYQPQPQTA